MSYADSPESNPYAAPVSAITEPEPLHLSAYTGYAGFWRRFVALLIDLMILWMASLGVMVTAFVVLPLTARNPGVSQTAVVVLYLLLLGGLVTYFAGMESSSEQATLGKMALGIKVTDLYGRRISFGRAVGRTFGKYLSAGILYIGFLMVAFTGKKQGLHDMVAGTLVLKSR